MGREQVEAPLLKGGDGFIAHDNPEPSGFIHAQMFHLNISQVAGVLLIESDKPHTIEPGESAITGANPQIAVGRLSDAGNPILRQTFVCLPEVDQILVCRFVTGHVRWDGGLRKSTAKQPAENQNTMQHNGRNLG